MRDIKFRFILRNKADSIKLDHCFRTLEQLRADSFICNDAWEIIATDEFTGLLDKNGKEICEGDLVRWMSGTGNVHFDRGRFRIAGFYAPLQDCPGDAFSENASLEVIGNIHENPDLLSKAAEPSSPA